jgi:NADP-reducing hydrogenase subunit HndB
MKSLEDLRKLREEALKNIEMRYTKGSRRIQVGMGTCGLAAGARPVMSKIIESIAEHKLKDIIVTQVGCMGECAYEPVIEIIDSDGSNTIYCQVTPEKVEKIIQTHLIEGKVLDQYVLYKTKK